jgi:hypothetical protein
LRRNKNAAGASDACEERPPMKGYGRRYRGVYAFLLARISHSREIFLSTTYRRVKGCTFQKKFTSRSTFDHNVRK